MPSTAACRTKVAKSPAIAADWSAPTEPVAVPRDSRLLAGPVKPAAGKLRLEGKDYVVQDGDVIHFRFNV